MEPTLKNMIDNCEQYNKYVTKNECYPIQKAYSTPHFLVLVVRVPQKTLAVYIGRGNQYLGVFVSEKIPPSHLRVQDRFLDYVRKYLVGAKLGKISFDREKELVVLTYKIGATAHGISFGAHNRQLFFCHENEITIASTMVKSLYRKTIEEYLQEVSPEVVLKKAISKKEKFLLRKKNHINSDLEISSLGFALEELILKNELNLDGEIFEFHGIKIKFMKSHNPWERKDLVFKKIKKLKKGTSILKSRLVEVENELEKMRSGQLVFEKIKERPLKILWSPKEIKAKVQENFLKISLNQVTGLLGLNASGNDEIRKESHKDHWWFHVENYSGAHLVLKIDDINNFLPEDYAVISSLLCDYSKLSLGEIPLMFTQIKNIKGKKGVKGEVIVNKCKYLKCPYSPWKERISIS